MFAVLFLPSFYLQAALRACPDQAVRPVGLVGSDKPHAPLIEVTLAARTRGVEPGLTPTQALARVPDLIVVRRDRAAEESVRAMLLDRARQMAPIVEDTGPGVLTLGVGTLGRVKDWHQWLLDLVSDLPGVNAQAGLGPVPWVAQMAAEEGRPCRVVGPGEEAAFLANLTVDRAEPDAGRREVLALWGVRTLGEVAALGREGLVARWGKEGGELWNRATGRADRPLVPLEEEVRWVEGKELEAPVETLEPLLFLLRRFVDLLLARLGERVQGIARLELKLALEDGTVWESVLDLPEPTRDGQRLFRVLHQHLEGVRTDAPVTGVWLEARPGEPPVRQPDLFSARLEQEETFRETLARLMALVGRDRVGFPIMEETHEPDRFRLNLHGPTAVASEHEEPSPALVLRRFRPPLVAEVRVGSGGPQAFGAERLAGEIVRVRGPWRSSGRWWEPDQAWEREEWDVETRDGRLFRLTQCGQRWVVEGIYD
ncbi:MAG: DNA polymerase Y family protein [Candidatus Methylacidiphilales bacterium]